MLKFIRVGISVMFFGKLFENIYHYYVFYPNNWESILKKYF